MHQHSRLGSLHSTSATRFDRLTRRATAVSSWTTRESYEIEAEVGTLVIDGLNAWRNFLKWYYISCALGARTMSGVRVAAGVAIPDVNSALGIAIVLFKKTAQPNSLGEWHRRDEPTWHDVNIFKRSAAAAGLSNMTDVNAAFSTGYSVFNDLPVFRNYFAHRTRETRAAAMTLGPSYGVGSNRKPSEVVRAIPPNRVAPVLVQWMTELRFTVDYMCN